MKTVIELSLQEIETALVRYLRGKFESDSNFYWHAKDLPKKMKFELLQETPDVIPVKRDPGELVSGKLVSKKKKAKKSKGKRKR